MNVKLMDVPSLGLENPVLRGKSIVLYIFGV